MLRIRNDLVRLMLDPATHPIPDGPGNPENHVDYLVSFEIAGRTWHAFKAYPGEIVKGWSLQAGSYYQGTSDSLDDFLSDPQYFADCRRNWRERGRPGWDGAEQVTEYPDRYRYLTVKFVSDDQWQESGIEDPL